MAFTLPPELKQRILDWTSAACYLHAALDIESKIQTIDSSGRSLVYCHERFRATTAASILLRESVGDIKILTDGVEGCSALVLPLEMAGTR